MKITNTLLLIFAVFSNTFAQSDRQQFIRIDAPVIALTHVRIIDGTGAAPIEDQTIVISEGKILSIGPNIPENAQILDLKGYTVQGKGSHSHRASAR